MSKGFELSIVTPGKENITYQIVSLKTKTLDGEIQFLANHMSVIIATVPCITTMRTEDGNETEFFTSTGLIYFEGNTLKFICDAVEDKENIDVERAMQSEERAKKRLSSNDSEIDMERVKLSLARSILRLDFANNK
ncbi:MAG: ATP synthase delta/epsilon chain alpha-helix domain-containing protein [Clostridium sp.]